MTKMSKGVSMATIFFALIAISIYAYIIRPPKGPINCTADATMHFSNGTLKLTYTVRMNKGDGLVSMLGTLNNNSSEIGKVSRQTYFDYTTDRFYYHFVSTRINKSGIDSVSDDVLSKYTPSFFIKPGEVRDFDIIPTNKSGWVFLMHSLPFIQCNNTLTGK